MVLAVHSPPGAVACSALLSRSTSMLASTVIGVAAGSDVFGIGDGGGAESCGVQGDGLGAIEEVET
jgi:hypothetical protein